MVMAKNIKQVKQDLAEATIIKMAMDHANWVLTNDPYDGSSHPQKPEHILKYPDSYSIEEITEAYNNFEEALDKILRLTKDNILDKVIP